MFGIASELGTNVEVINHPWANRVDPKWLGQITESADLLICVENHFTIGGLGDRVASLLGNFEHHTPKLLQIGLDQIPVGGQNSEVLAHHQLNKEGIFRRISEALC